MSDHRFERTDNEIKHAFLNVLKETSFNKMTITELADACMIERTTFYDHFSNLYEVAKAIIDDILMVVEGYLTENGRKKNAEISTKYHQLLNQRIVSYFNVHKEVVEEIRLIPLGINGFDVRFRNLVKKHFSQMVSIPEDSFINYLMVNLAMSDVDYVLDNGYAPTLADLRKGLNMMLSMLD